MSKYRDDVFLSSRLWLAAFAGAISYFAYPKPGLWPVIFIAGIGIFASIRGATLPRAYLIGFVAGFTFFASQGWWLSQYLGPVPLIALSTVEALFVGLWAVVFEAIRRKLTSHLMQALAFASTWTAREWLTTHFPYGGYPWSRLAMSQGYSPLDRWVFFGGLSLLTFVLAFASAILILEGPNLFSRFTRRAAIRSVGVTLVVLFAVPATVTLQPSDNKFTIAAVQGNANAGLFAKTYPGEVLDNHLDVTNRAIKVGATKGVSLVVWPENASDLNPLLNAGSGATMAKLVNEQLRIPLAFGTITSSGDDIFNSSLLWLPGSGIVDQYDKKRPIPFAEYVPDRAFWNALAPDLIGLIYRGYTFGTRDNYFEVDGHRFGVLICFEVAVDEVAREIVDSGAEAILSQSNNADFGKSDEAFQQLALARLRNIETGLPVVNASTVGPSAIFDAGRTVQVSDAFVPAFLVGEIGLAKSNTPAMSFGRYFDLANLYLFGVICLVTVFRARRRSVVTP